MAKRRKEEAQETRERILDAAITVFHARGVARPSLTDIAALAGVTRGAVYGHFRNKADLFSALAERIRLPTEMMCEPAGAHADPLGELRSRWAFLFRQVATNRDWQLILDIILHRCELTDETGGIRERLLQTRQQGMEQLAQLLKEAIAAKQLPRQLDIPFAVMLLHGSLIGLLQDWLLAPAAFDIAAEGERQVDVLIDVLRTAEKLHARV